MKYSSIPLNLLLLLCFFYSKAQTPGEIFEPSSGTSIFLDPDNDGFITATGAAFSSGTEQSQFESTWAARYQIVSEPSGDASTGSPCASTDIVDEPGEKYALYTSVYDPDGYPTNNDGDEYFLVRLRIGKDPGSANFGYSILMDTDSKYGSGTDLNAVSGNQGFEVEIRLKNGGGGKGVHLDDVDGTTSGTNKESYAHGTHHQKSYAAYTATGCNNDPVFVDIAVPFSDLTTHFSVTPLTSLRLVAATTSSGASALNANVSDISGTDDDDPSYITIEDALDAVTSGQPSNQSLPVDLISMLVWNQNNEYQLQWETASEVNTDFFDIQVSQDGTNFTSTDKITAQGTSITGYKYQQQLPAPSDLGFYFVRLRMVDFDGFTEYSNVALVGSRSNNEALEPSIYPIPAKEILYVSLNSNGAVPYSIRNLMGNEIQHGTCASGQSIDLVGMSSGVYFICFSEQTDTVPVKFTVR